MPFAPALLCLSLFPASSLLTLISQYTLATSTVYQPSSMTGPALSLKETNVNLPQKGACAEALAECFFFFFSACLLTMTQRQQTRGEKRKQSVEKNATTKRLRTDLKH